MATLVTRSERSPGCSSPCPLETESKAQISDRFGEGVYPGQLLTMHALSCVLSMCIVNDEMFVRNATTEEIRRAFVAPAPTPSSSPVPTLSATQQEMLSAFSQQSGMNLEWSQKYDLDALHHTTQQYTISIKIIRVSIWVSCPKPCPSEPGRSLIQIRTSDVGGNAGKDIGMQYFVISHGY